MKTTPEPTRRTRRLFIVAGETSGDTYGAALARELLAQEPRLRIAGLGGPKMARAGVHLFHDLASHAVMGVAGLLDNIAGLAGAYRTITHKLSAEKPDAIVLIDFPEFNLMVARHAKKIGVPVIYYVSPQLWAWRPGRIRKIARRVSKMLCLFEFEKRLYEEAGVDVVHVGHPLLDTMAEKLTIADKPEQRAAVRRSLGLPESGTVVGLLPGSRRKEVRCVFPILLRAAEIIQAELGDVTVVTAAAEALDVRLFEAVAARHNVEANLVSGRAHDVMLASDLLLVCSGTATLEAALLGTPMVATYQADLLNYVIFGTLISTYTWALANIAAGERIVPELYMIDAKPGRIAAAALELLRGKLDETRRRLRVVRERLGRPGASARAAAEILKTI